MRKERIVAVGLAATTAVGGIAAALVTAVVNGAAVPALPIFAVGLGPALVAVALVAAMSLAAPPVANSPAIAVGAPSESPETQG